MLNPIHRKYLLFVSILFLLTHVTFTQESLFEVNGKLISEKEIVPFATILVKNQSDSVIVKSGFSDSLGYFAVKGIKQGYYFLTASMIGFSAYKSAPFEIQNKNVELGVIELSADNELKTVDVVVIRPIIEVKPDKTVFNVEGTINATGTNILDLLRKAPGVIIDNNNNIIIEGKSGGQIYFDGKPSILAGEDLINFLMSMQSSDVDNIEIISQPSSKYDAAGNGGIINIVLKRDKNIGTNGTAAIGYAYGVNHHFNSAFSINHRNKKSNVYALYSNGFGKNYNFIFLDREQFGTLYEERTESNNAQNSHNGKVGVDWFLSPKHTIGVLASGSYFTSDSRSVSNTNIGAIGFSTPSQILESNNQGQGENYQLTGNLNYGFKDTLGHEFTVDLDYGVYNRDQSDYLPNVYFDGGTGSVLFENNYRMVTPTQIDVLTGKFDYGQYFLGGRFEFGAKYSNVNTVNTLDYYDVISEEDIFNDSRSNKFNYSEEIIAGYINYSRKIKEKWGIQVGVRAEQTNSIGNLASTQTSDDDLVERHYLNWFPSGGINFTPSKDNTWGLTFGKRINRPNYQTLNPFTWQMSDLSSRKGNPFLQPQYGNNIKISHTYKYRFNTSISYSYVQDFFAEVTDTLGLNKNFVMARNVADEQMINLGASLPFQIKKWWSTFIGLNAFYTSYLGTDERFVPIERFTFNGFMQNTFLLPKGFKFEISGWFSSPSVWGGTYLTKSMGSLDVAIEKRFLKDRLSVRLSGSDLLFTSPWRANIEYGELAISGTGGRESRMLRFNLTYFFGRSEIERTRKRQTGLEEEQGRTGSGGGR